jgi:hypothetical protein
MQLHTMRARSLVSLDQLENSLRERSSIKIEVQEDLASFDFCVLEKSIDRDGYEVYSGIAVLRSMKNYSRLNFNDRFVAQLATRDGEVSWNVYMVSATCGPNKEWTQDEYNKFVKDLNSRRRRFSRYPIRVVTKNQDCLSIEFCEDLGVSGQVFWRWEENDTSHVEEKMRRLVDHFLLCDGVMGFSVNTTRVEVILEGYSPEKAFEDILRIYCEGCDVEVIENNRS